MLFFIPRMDLFTIFLKQEWYMKIIHELMSPPLFLQCAKSSLISLYLETEPFCSVLCVLLLLNVNHNIFNINMK